MRQAITTKFLGPTNHRAARIKASAQAGNVTVAWDHALGAAENHCEAAKALALSYGWDGVWAGGANAEGDGYVFVQVAGQSTAFELGTATKDTV